MELLEEIKLRLASDNPEQKIDTLLDAWEYGVAGIELVINALEDSVREVRQSALLLLLESETEIAKQALQNYLPFAQMQCLHTIANFKFDSFHEEYHPDYFAIANYNNSLVGYWNLNYKRAGVAIWDLATANIKKNYDIAAHECGLGKQGRLLVTNYQHHSHVYELETAKEIINYSSEFFICGIHPTEGEFVVCETNDPFIAKSECRGTIGRFEIWNYDTYLCSLDYKFRNFTLFPTKIAVGNSGIKNGLTYTSPLIFTPDGKFLIVYYVDKQKCSLVQIWNTKTSELFQILENLPKLTITSVGVRPTGTIVACGIREDKVCVWELQSDKIIYSTPEMSPCILSTDGRVLIYTTADNEIVIRDLVAEQDLCVLQGHDAPVAYLALSSDREFVASYSIDREIKIWGIPN